MTHMHHHHHHHSPYHGSRRDFSHNSGTHVFGHQHSEVDIHNCDEKQCLPNFQPSSQSLKNGIGNAFERSDVTKNVDPELIAHITAAVIDEIRLSGLATPPQTLPVSQQQQHGIPSPASSVPARDAFTPSLLNRGDVSTKPCATQEPLSRDIDGTGDTPALRAERSPPGETPRERTPTRPRPPQRIATEDYSPIEKIWQRLFTMEGEPLPRLGQFLRGLALHLIETYEPKKTLVISPSKMLRFYNEVKVQDEVYPWRLIFGELTYPALSKIYRDLRCEHHLIQEHPAEPPSIPALTPEGFEAWMTVMIMAYPDVEYQRIAKAVLDMPISNADERKERFPKELPRRLLPTIENLQAQQLCAVSLSSETVGPLHRAPAFPPPPPKIQRTPGVPNIERERSPYVSKLGATSFAPEGEPDSPSAPIERKRKPYSSIPGAGKTYDNEADPNMNSTTTGNLNRGRAQSTAKPTPFTPPLSDTFHHSRAYSNVFPIRPENPGFADYGVNPEPDIQGTPRSYYASDHSFGEDPRVSIKDGTGSVFD